MALRIRTLSVRIDTPIGPCGVTIPFDNGLNVVRADNTSGKSACMQAIIYGLGVEGMYGPRHEIPLPHAITDFLEVDGLEHPVLASEVWLEVENHEKKVITIRRPVKGHEDTHLVSVWEGAVLSGPNHPYRQRDFKVRRHGSATDETGFHHYLERFVGWDLPYVPRFDGSEGKLYMECLFPLMSVEQKRGWGYAPPASPVTYLGIRDSSKRSLEYILQLDYYRSILERQRLKERSADLRSRWLTLVSKSKQLASGINGILIAMPEEPVMSWPPTPPPQIAVFTDGEALTGIGDILEREQKKLNELNASAIPTLNEQIMQIQADLKLAEEKLAEKLALASSIQSELMDEQAEGKALVQRCAALELDIKRYREVLTLRALGSKLGLAHTQKSCPTCHQSVPDSLLPSSISVEPMTLDDNLSFLVEQLKTTNLIQANHRKVLQTKELMFVAMQSEINDLRSHIRSLRASLLQDGREPSIAAVRMRVKMEENIERQTKVVDDFEVLLSQFYPIAEEYRQVLSSIKELPKDGLSKLDTEKLQRLELEIQEKTQRFGLTSVSPSSLGIHPDTYRVTYEELDINFDLSASDLIRVTWAYLLGLLQLSRTYSTNHLGLLMLDEPRQQSADPDSFAELLKVASASSQYDQQVIITTSEKKVNFEQIVAGIQCTVINFDSKIMQAFQS